MKYSTRLSNAAHILVFIAENEEEKPTSATIATSLATNPSQVRQLMAQMKAAGIIASEQGRANPTLARDAEKISLLDVYRAVEGEKPLLHINTQTNPACGIGVNVQHALAGHFDQIQLAAENKMDAISIADVMADYFSLSRRAESDGEQPQ